MAIGCALLLSACSSGGSKTSSTTSTTSEPANAAAGAAANCSKNLATGTATIHVTNSGRERTVVVHVPPSAKAGLPLVLNMHGSGSTARAQEAFSDMNATADKHGFVVAYPQAAIPAEGGYDWNVPGQPLLGGQEVPAGAPNDVAFLQALVGTMIHDYCVSDTHVYATGMSGGARMASQLACDASGTFAAVAPVAGLRFPAGCRPARAVPVLAFHGTADPIDPYNGNGQPYWTYSVPVAAQRWAAQNGCRPASGTISKPPVMTTTYSGCRDNATVQLVSISGMGHQWPGGPTVPESLVRELGPQSNAVNANEQMWQFFSAHAPQ
jgi:polyhydroxybutyrate depolymerase